MRRPRLLLVPLVTEVEWMMVRPALEEWAEVASFDAPGVGKEPPAKEFGREAIVARGLAELDQRDWMSCIVVADGSGIATAVRLAQSRPEVVEALALGHARLSDDMGGERPTRNREVFEAVGQLLRVDYGNFVRYGFAQATRGSFGEELAQLILERVPEEVGRAAWKMVVEEGERFEPVLRKLNVPLLFAKHEGCLGETEEGFADAVAAFPGAERVSVPEAPSVSSDFAAALRSFVERLASRTPSRDHG